MQLSVSSDSGGGGSSSSNNNNNSSSSSSSDASATVTSHDDRVITAHSSWVGRGCPCRASGGEERGHVRCASDGSEGAEDEARAQVDAVVKVKACGVSHATL